MQQSLAKLKLPLFSLFPRTNRWVIDSKNKLFSGHFFKEKSKVGLTTISTSSPVINSYFLSFVEYSDSTESHSSSPSSETYAQLEPSDCHSCGNNSKSHDIPPKLPDTPRPSKQSKISCQAIESEFSLIRFVECEETICTTLDRNASQSIVSHFLVFQINYLTLC